ncbi:NACHT domain-containing protein [Actinopolymorpha pittospori]|uniref:NACHT domain-containing protein n=1 Tax=Actinopolymorpha pittospori TaxID=648752 RepID=A0A927RAA7_9ACTN|nr:hypothetical protein [Actinopolymorpha pittospori]MBE1604845.1 hypothetical protein [Actinopolymorpha pittospori]
MSADSEGTAPVGTYRYEQLHEGKFQMLCQALLVREFPGVQCFPINMPDGGRDALLPAGPNREGIVFQVKLARTPEKIRDYAEWVIDAVKGELEKVNKLALRGVMSNYLLITNISGSSHLDVGSIDRVDRFLADSLPLPAQCWWADDLDRRVDSAWDLKLRYPDLLNGPDVVRLLWERSTSDGRNERRSDALKAYVTHQHSQENTVRFKQAALSPTPLADLFIDVPATLRPVRDKENKALSVFIDVLHSRHDESSSIGQFSQLRMLMSNETGEVVMLSRGRWQPAAIGGADLLLDDHFSSNVRRIVLEGAPGQGKSTLVQYLAELQRMRLLGELDTSDPSHNWHSPLVLPLKLELRDLAVWLNGYNPWEPSRRTEHGEQPTFETALAGQIRTLSGGIQFDVGDLHSTVRSTPVVLLLDALDEVADLEDRRLVVEQVSSGINRLESSAQDLRVVITSRPTAIANSPTFPQERFTYLKLAPISPELALDYTDKWARAMKVNDRDIRELRSVLSSKMDAPHMADLAKNTMQLSILLDLIQHRGSSLPDKRTELYDTYMDVFLNREAEKSPIVRQQRPLIVDIHRYLAFTLHSMAENDRASGRINAAELEELLTTYLKSEGQPLDIVANLRMGVVERFFALTSNIQGTYEFEVQPIREYFAARYLYETAPYSPTGRERDGTLPDRFLAVARSPYWMNVARFLGGCFSKGELPALADCLIELLDDPDLRYSRYPRALSVQLLQDWVFTQSVRSTNAVVDAVFDDLGLRFAAVPGGVVGEGSALHETAGGRRLASIVWRRLRGERANSRARGLAELMANHSDTNERAQLWVEEFLNRSEEQRPDWLEVGKWLRVLDVLSVDLIERIIDHEIPAAYRDYARSIFVGSAPTAVDRLPEKLRAEVVGSVLGLSSGKIYYGYGEPGCINGLAQASSTVLWRFSVSRAGGVPPVEPACSGTPRHSEVLESVHEVHEALDKIRTGEVRESLQPWIKAINELDSAFGRTWVAYQLAVLSAAILDPKERGAGAGSLFSTEYPLPARVRNARRRARRLEWWKLQLSDAGDYLERAFWVMTLLVWADSSVIEMLLREIDAVIRDLSDVQQAAFASSLSNIGLVVDQPQHRRSVRVPADMVGSLHPATLYILVDVRGASDTSQVVREGLLPNVEKYPWLANRCFPTVLLSLLQSSIRSEEDVAVLEQLYNLAGQEASSVWEQYGGVRVRSSIPLSWWIKRMERPWDLPSRLLDMGERVISDRSKKVRSVASIADSESWFEA